MKCFFLLNKDTYIFLSFLEKNVTINLIEQIKWNVIGKIKKKISLVVVKQQ